MERGGGSGEDVCSPATRRWMGLQIASACPDPVMVWLSEFLRWGHVDAIIRPMVIGMMGMEL